MCLTVNPDKFQMMLFGPPVTCNQVKAQISVSLNGVK
nr:unnamed protein product [Callosobruchus analis]